MPSIPTAIGIASVPVAHRMDTPDTAHLTAVKTFPDCPPWCTYTHSQDLDHELELRLHERVALEVESTDAEAINQRATARVVVERCDALGELAGPANIVLGIDHPDAPDASEVDIAEVTRHLSDPTCRALAAMCMTGGMVTGMALTLQPAAARELSDALRQAANWAALASATNGTTRRGAA